jgi:serine protease
MLANRRYVNSEREHRTDRAVVVFDAPVRLVLVLIVFLALAAPARAWIPNDPGSTGTTPGGWQNDQWNFLPGTGIDAPRAWDNLIAAGRPGGFGVRIAIVDSGVRRSPDLSNARMANGWDFCSRRGRGDRACRGHDRNPADEYGHGTHVASTIAETTNNGRALTGIAYGATIIPVKVLNDKGEGDERTIADGIRYAANRRADIINLAFEFDSQTFEAKQIPLITRAVRYARSRGVLIVGAAGNTSFDAVSYPAALPGVISVGAITEHGCLAEYSNTGEGLDLVAPGGGSDSPLLGGQPGCQPDGPHGRSILQLSFTRGNRRFAYPRSYRGTSMAAAHVSAAAALVIASGVMGVNPSPSKVEARLKATARDLGRPGKDFQYGSGLIDAGAATAPLTAAH